MRDFEYEAPTQLAAAVELLARHNGHARPLAGGTDLIDHVRTGRLSPDVVVDIKRIAELNVLASEANGLRLGAAVSCAQVASHPDIAKRFTALVDSARIIGGVQIQNRASIGGNLCNAGPAADSTPSVIALGGRCVIAGPKGTREVSTEEFCTGPGQNVLAPGELLVEIQFPAPPANTGSHYRRFIPRNEMDIAVVGVAAAITLDPKQQTVTSARIALGAVAPKPLLATESAAALIGQPLTDDVIAKAATAARKIATPITDMRGTAEYRLHLVGVLVERVVKAAAARARGESIEYKPGH